MNVREIREETINAEMKKLGIINLDCDYIFYL